MKPMSEEPPKLRTAGYQVAGLGLYKHEYEGKVNHELVRKTDLEEALIKFFDYMVERYDIPEEESHHMASFRNAFFVEVLDSDVGEVKSRMNFMEEEYNDE